MANDIEDRYLSLLLNSPYIADVVRPGQTPIKVETFVYNVSVGTAAAPLTLAAGAISANMVTQADSDFVIAYLSGGVTLTAAGDMKFNRNLTLQIQDLASGKFFYSAPMLMALAVGGGGFPFQFMAPRVIRPNSTVQFTAQNRDTTQDYFQMQLTVTGTKLYYA